MTGVRLIGMIQTVEEVEQDEEMAGADRADG